MKLTLEDIEELEILRANYLRGGVTEQSYLRIRKAFFQERGLPEDFDDLALLESRGDDDRDSIPIEFLTTCSAKGKLARNEHLLAQQETKERGYVSKALRTKSARPSRTEEINSADASIARWSRAHSASSKASYRRKGLISTGLTISFALAVTIFICRSAPVEELIATLQPYDATAVAVPEVSMANVRHFIRPLFGPVAIDQCTARCSDGPQGTQTECKRSCKRLSIPEYARRITLRERTPKEDAEELIARCRAVDSETLSPMPRNRWQEEIQSTLQAIDHVPSSSQLSDFGNTRLLYNTMFDANRNLTQPLGGNAEELKLTKQMVEATCLRANLALTELGILMSMQSSDEYSRRYYSGLHKNLRLRTLDVENIVIAKARNTGFLLNDSHKHGRK